MIFLEWLQLTGKIFYGNIYLWSVMKKSSVSRTQRFTCFQILFCVLEGLSVTVHDICIHSIPFLLVLVAVSSQLSSAMVIVSCMFWWSFSRHICVAHRRTSACLIVNIFPTRMNQNPESNYAWEESWRGSKVHHNTELWTQLMVSQWNSSGIFSQDSPHCSSAKNERSTWRIWRTDHLHVDVQWHLMVIWSQWTGMRSWRQPRFYLCKKISTRMMVIPRTWIRKEVVFYSW